MSSVYRERAAVAALAPAVACVWTQRIGQTATASYEQRVVPDACVDVIWRDERLEIAGPDTEPVLTSLTADSSVVGIRFRPGHGGRFLGVAASELTDARVTLDELWGASARVVADRLAGASTPSAAERVLEDAVLERARHAPDVDDVVEPLVAMLSADPPSSVRDAARTLAFSERQLRRRCLDAFGYGPKMLDRILRFQRFLRVARATDAPFARLAAACGYSDEAHLAHECRALGGTRPSVLAGRPLAGE
jgi:AraC-like DNA-binding protein